MRFPIAITAILVAAPVFAQSTTDTTKVTVQQGQGGTFTVQPGQGQGGTVQFQISGGGISMGQGGGMTMSMGGNDAAQSRSGLALNTPASLGMSLAATGSKRDTLGLFVEAVAPNGPAERAGIIEGDRIVSIDTVNLHLAGLAAEDPSLKVSLTSLLRETMAAVKPGTTLRIKVYSDGKTRTVTVTPDKWSSVYTAPAAEKSYAPIAIM